MDQRRIRNFAIIAHVDHGKSTLSDRFLELTGAVDRRSHMEQILDRNPTGREHGVTIELAPVTMTYKIPNTEYRIPNEEEKINQSIVPHSEFSIQNSVFMLNLIDTPGHVDFSYEVERSLAACEGAILLVDATQGIQAQTIAHAQKAIDLGLTVIPALNKIDLPNSEIDRCIQEILDTFGFHRDEVALVSAKTGEGVPELLDRVVRDVPAPGGRPDAHLRALIFTSTFDPHVGVIAYVRIVDGTLEKNDSIRFMATDQSVIPKELGVFTPTRQPTDALTTGQVGYVATGMKDIHRVHVGDTITAMSSKQFAVSSSPLPGYRRPTPMVFANVFPGEDSTYHKLLDAVQKLKLSDASLTSSPVHSPVLGAGLQMGFLGLFHMEITGERLEREHGIRTTLTTPTVAYRVRRTNGAAVTVTNPNDFPDPSAIREVLEPMCTVTVITPAASMGPLMQVLENRRGQYQDTTYLGSRAKLAYLLPLAELVSGLFDDVKSASHGFASLDYELTDLKPVDAVKLDLLVHHDPVEPLSRIVVRDQAVRIGRAMVEKFKELLPAQQFAVPIQAAVGGTILARETKPALRKDVTAKLYGGDQTRKDKLLKKQKKGKKKMARIGSVTIPDDVLTNMALS